MLAYLIRHLETLESDKDQTGMVDSEEEKMLKGFNLSNSLIDGIWIWNKPFILKDEDEEDIAVVLLATDVTINDEAFSKIFGLSLLTSTIMIMNLETLEEEILSELIPYVELATLAKNDLEDGDAFFHRLSFLISDWNDTGKFPHGSKGGRKFLEQKLQLHDGDSLELVQVRKCLEKYFKELNCFLMPRVGENGECQRITLTDAETYHNFAKKLEEYLQLFIHPENLIKMELLGEILNRNEFQRLFETFENIFNSDCSPQAETFWKATCQIVNENVLEKAIKKYLSLMEARLNGMAYAQKDDLEQAHFRSFSQVKDFFKKAKKFGINEPFPDLRKQLGIKIDAEFTQMRANNEENRATFVSQAISEAHADFQNELERQLPLYEADLTSFYDDIHFRKVVNTLKACVMGVFKDKLEKEDQEEIPSLINKVQGLLDSAFATHLDKNNLHRKNAEEMMKSVISSLLEKWRISFASFLDQNKIEENVPKFQAFHNTLKISALHEELTSSKKAENAEVQQKSQALLVQNMDQQFSSLVKTHLHNISKMKAKQLALIDHVIKDHDGKLQRNVAKYEGMDAHELRMEIARLFHIHESFVYLTNFQNSSPFPKEAQAYSQLETKLQNSLDLPLNRVIHRLNSYKQKCRESCQLAGDKSFAFYREKLGAFVDSGKCLKVKDLQEEHKQLANWAFVKFVNEEKTGEVDNEKEILSDLQVKMQSYLETAQTELKKSRANAKENGKIAANEYATAYKKELTSRVEQAQTKDELWKFHSDGMANGVTYLEQRIPKKFPNILQKFQHKLFQSMTEALQKYKSHFNSEMPTEIKCGAHFAPAIGIDLGTTECCVAVYLNGKVTIIPNMEQGFALTTPSYVGFSLNGEVTIGKVAKSNKFQNPTQTIYDLKRIIGRHIDDCELQQDLKYWPFTLKEYDGVLKIVVNRQFLHPEQVLAQLLSYLRLMAEKFLKLEPGRITKAVITVPACFNDGQRQATLDAAKLAGLEGTLLNEPTAAAIAYSMERMETSKKILVYDLGEGTFDVALIEVNGRDVNVLGVNGDAHLGGDDFDNNMINYCVEEFKKKHRIDLLRGRDSINMMEREETRFRLGRLKTQCELVRDYLSHFTKATVTVLSIMDRIDLKVEVTRDTFAALNYHLIAKTVKLMEEVLSENGLKKEEVDDILLLGGSSRIPIVGEMLEKYFGGRKLNKSIHPGHSLASGAALLAAKINGMQAVGKVEFGSIQDITSIPIYIEIEGDLSVIFEKNLKIPVSKQRIIRTAFDNQAEICVKIIQWDRSFIAARNKLLGEFLMSGIKPKEAGEEIEISIEIDEMGILHVMAKQGLNRLTVTEDKKRMSDEIISHLLATVIIIQNKTQLWHF